jgi:hypothetical protein
MFYVYFLKNKKDATKRERNLKEHKVKEDFKDQVVNSLSI